MESNGMKNLKSKKLYLQVYDEIKDYISKNQLGPGDKLPSEMKMCEMLGVSRNVLREAIKSLEITGVVHSTPGVGIVIEEFNTDLFISNLIYNINDDVSLYKQVEEMRRVLELGFTSQVFDTITDKELDAMEETLRRMDSLSDELKRSHTFKLGTKFVESDAMFHRIMFSQVDNRLVKSIIEFYWACDKFYKERTTEESLEETVKKHRMILDALRGRDYDKFCEAMQYHFAVNYPKL